MPVPLPDERTVDLNPPDAVETETIIRGLIGAVSGPAGLTELQYLLLRSVAKSMTGFAVDPAGLDPLSPAELAEALRRRNAIFRTRILHLMLLGELVLPPDDQGVCAEVGARVDAYAAELSVDGDDSLALTRRYAGGALGLALHDFQRNGYTADWDPAHTERFHSRVSLTEPWQQVVDDPALHARWESLADCTPGSLGEAVSRFYQARGFTFPGVPESAPPFLTQHDWVHVLADYGTTVESELEVFGLIARAIPDPKGFSLLAMVVSLFETGALARVPDVFEANPGHLSAHGMAVRLGDAMRRGALCGHDLMALDWFEFADRPVGEVRATLALHPKDHDAVAAGSVGPWQPGGITPYQFAAGRKAAEAAGRPYDPYGARPV